LVPGPRERGRQRSVRRVDDDDGDADLARGDELSCTTPTGAATKNGTVQSQKLTWGETGTFSNGNDDGRTVVVEVRAPATGCSSGATWQLNVQGDT
jgi:hypothetical protein